MPQTLSSSFTSSSDSSGESSDEDMQEESSPHHDQVTAKESKNEESEEEENSGSESESESGSESEIESDVVTTATYTSQKGKNSIIQNEFTLVPRKPEENVVSRKTPSKQKESKQQESGKEDSRRQESKHEDSSALKEKKVDSLKRLKDSSEPIVKGSSKKLKKATDEGKSDKINREVLNQNKETTRKVDEYVNTVNGSQQTKDKKSELKKAEKSTEEKRSEKERSKRDRNENKKNLGVKRDDNENENENENENGNENGLLSPEKPKLWSPIDEITVSEEMIKAMSRGVELTSSKKSDPCWYHLSKKLEGKLEGGWSRDKIFEKSKRMRTRYLQMAEKVRDSNKPFKFRNEMDEKLFGLWEGIWGNGSSVKAENTETDHKEIKLKVNTKNDKAGGKGKESKMNAETEKAEGDNKKPKMRVGNHVFERKLRNSSPTPSKKSKIACENLVNSAIMPNIADQNKDIIDEPKENHSENEETDGNHDESEEDTAGESEEQIDLKEKKSLESPMEVDMKEITNMEATSLSDIKRYIKDEIKLSVSALGEASIELQKEWQLKTIDMVEMYMKEATNQLAKVRNELINLKYNGGLNPMAFNDIDLRRIYPGIEESYKDEWHELQIKELDAFKARLDLMQKVYTCERDKFKGQSPAE